jgi:hypothetical protein
MVWERKRFLDWSRVSGTDRVQFTKSIVGLISLSHGNPRMMFSLPRERTSKVIHWVIPLMLRNRIEVKQMILFLLMELSTFWVWMEVVRYSVGR